jgi:hypothetical protein
MIWSCTLTGIGSALVCDDYESQARNETPSPRLALFGTANHGDVVVDRLKVEKEG